MGEAFTPEWLEEHAIDPLELRREDVIGISHARDEVSSLAARLSDPVGLRAMGGSLPRGLLLFGQPGTGKTLLARYLAAEWAARVPRIRMFELSADELDPERIRAIFRHLARLEGPTVLDLDEIDGFARNRESDLHHDRETRRMLVAMLSGLDGIRDAGDVVVVCAANTPPALLDRALMRPQRIGVWIHVTLPNAGEREQLFRLFLREVPFEDDIEPAELARIAGDRCTPAAIKGFVQDAVSMTFNAGRALVTRADLLAALERAGRVEPDPSPVEVSWRVAVHEAGHAAAMIALCGPASIRAMKADDHGGSTTWVQNDEVWASDDTLLLDAAVVGYAGIAAERLVLGAASLGGRDGLDLMLAAERSIGFTGADIEATVRAALAHSLVTGRDRIEQATLEELILRAGHVDAIPLPSVDELEQRAVHEAGHAIIAALHWGPAAVAAITLRHRGDVAARTEFAEPLWREAVLKERAYVSRRRA